MAGGTFQELVKAHLATYKREVLGVAEDGVWLKNKKPYAHILPLTERELNILPRFRRDFWRWFPRQGIRLHSDFHHLNSSQALCFNLFFPLLAGDGSALRTVLEALNIPGEPGPGAVFEFEPDAAEGTNFDFVIPLTSGARVFFEIKYSENDFGSAKNDIQHLDKFERIYRRRLPGRLDSQYSAPGPFLVNYQILRNIWHLNRDPRDMAVFLYPRANAPLRRKEHVIRNCALEPFRSSVHVCYMEDLLASLDENCRPLTDFRAKYFPR